MSARRGRVAPLQLRLQDLPAVSADRIVTGQSAFGSAPLEEVTGKPKPGHWRERDLRRALAVAKRAGIANYRVEIGPDGTISIVVTDRKASARR